MKSKIRLGIGSLLTLLLLLPIATAFGVTTPHWNENPLVMYAGQSKDVDLILQNMVGSEDIYLKAEITQGSNIASLDDPNQVYLVPLGTKDVVVTVRVSVPENAQLNGDHDIQVSFVQTFPGDGGMLQLSGAVATTIPVTIRSEEQVTSEEKARETGGQIEAAAVSNILGVNYYLLFGILLAGLLIIVIFIHKLKNNENEYQK